MLGINGLEQDFASCFFLANFADYSNSGESASRTYANSTCVLQDDQLMQEIYDCYVSLNKLPGGRDWNCAQNDCRSQLSTL